MSEFESFDYTKVTVAENQMSQYMDGYVHDVGAYKTGEDWRAYEAGMVVTVEPGLYVAPDDETVDAKWRGIGIRIEDDIVVTESGPLVLTKNVVKTVEEIEQLMAS
jgi:Xaa-Pro aminopeptidase